MEPTVTNNNNTDPIADVFSNFKNVKHLAGGDSWFDRSLPPPFDYVRDIEVKKEDQKKKENSSIKI
jgi:hypothetical protein